MTTTFFIRDTIEGTVLWASDGSPFGQERKLAIVSPNGQGAFGLAAGAKVYLAGTDADGLQVLWVSDGTPAGTVPLTPAVPAGSRAVFEHAVELDGVVYFASDRGTQLWKTDGTQAGTALIKDFGSAIIDDMTIAGGQIFLVAGPQFSVGSLWTTDGSAEGTVPVANQNDVFGGLAPAGDYVVYATGRSSQQLLWASDGTEAGTFALPGSPSGYSEFPSLVAAVGDTVFFMAADDAHGTDLWRTDIANRNAVFVKDTNPGPSPRDFRLSSDNVTVFDGALYFTFFELNLWRSDGTDAGTFPITQFRTNHAINDEIIGLVTAGDHMMFFVSVLQDNRVELWRSDGTTAGTARVKAFDATNPQKFVPAGVEVVGNTIYFKFDSGDGLDMWRSDGTDSGTYKVTDVEPAWEMNLVHTSLDTRPLPMTVLGDKLFFAAAGPSTDGMFESVPALWVSDGTHAGTHLLKDLVALNPYSLNSVNGSIPPHNLTVVGDTLFFVASDGRHGGEVWKSDGTAAGTVMIKDIFPPPVGTDLVVPEYLTAFADALYFLQPDDQDANGRFVVKLWRTDGTDAGTSMVDVSPFDMVGLSATKDTLFVTGNYQSSYNPQIWGVGGAGAAPVLLTNFVVNQLDLISETEIPTDNKLFFQALDRAGTGIELWVSDGTAAGTHIVKDIRPGTERSDIEQATAVGDRLFFVADDGVSGSELWTSDGTDAGTHLVQDTIAGPGGPFMSGFTAFKGVLFYQGADFGHGWELWRSDGTDAGTHIVKDILTGTGSSVPRSLTVVGDTLYFVSSNGGNSDEIWKTDGTEIGTVRVTESDGFSEAQIVGAMGDHLYYTLGNSTTTTVLMRTDGTAAGTEVVAGRYANTNAHPELMANASINLAAPPQGSDFQADGNDDYNPEGSDDVLFRHVGDGQLYFAAMNGGAFTDWGVATAPLGTQTVGGWGDVDRNGYDDIFVQGSDGGLAIALQNGTDAPGWLIVPTGLDASWKLVGAADLNRDGYADAILQNESDGAIQFANMAGGAFQGLTVVNGNITADWRVAGTGDINGDGFVDLVIQQQSTGTTYYADMANGAFNGWGLIADAVTRDWIVQAVADVNGDAHVDVIFQNLAGAGPAAPAGTTYWADLHTGTVVWGAVTAGITADWAAKGVADVNDDGSSDVIFQNLVGRPPSGNDPGIIPGTVYYAEVNGGGVGVPSWGVVTTGATAEWHVL